MHPIVVCNFSRDANIAVYTYLCTYVVPISMNLA